MPIRQLFEKMDDLLEKIDLSESRRNKIIDFMESCPAMCFIKESETGRYTYVNESFKHYFGQEVIGMTDSDIFPLDDAIRWVGHDLQVLKTEQPIETIETMKIPSGEQRCFLVSKFIILNGEKYIGGLAFELPDSVALKKPRLKVEGTK